MSDEKTVIHIEIRNEKASLVWSVLSNNFQFVIDKKQHSIDGKDVNFYIHIEEMK